MRSTRPDVRNPLLQLKSARELGAWLEAGTARVLARFLEDLARDARARAQESWTSHKAPMALYWKVVAVYARHLARILRAIGGQAESESAPGPASVIYREALEQIIANGDRIGTPEAWDVAQAAIDKANRSAAAGRVMRLGIEARS